MTLFKLLSSLFHAWYSLKFVGETLPHTQRVLRVILSLEIKCNPQNRVSVSRLYYCTYNCIVITLNLTGCY